MTTDNSNKIIPVDKTTSIDNNRDFKYWALLTLTILFHLIILHISVICIIDIAGRNNGTTINYPIIHNYFVWGIFFLPLIGGAFLFVKKLSYRLLGSYLIIVSVWDIYLFLKATEGAL
jgi:hypothetical protein